MDPCKASKGIRLCQIDKCKKNVFGVFVSLDYPSTVFCSLDFRYHQYKRIQPKFCHQKSSRINNNSSFLDKKKIIIKTAFSERNSAESITPLIIRSTQVQSSRWEGKTLLLHVGNKDSFIFMYFSVLLLSLAWDLTVAFYCASLKSTSWLRSQTYFFNYRNYFWALIQVAQAASGTSHQLQHKQKASTLAPLNH